MNKFSKFPADVICELHPLFKGLLWVSAARSDDDTRFVLNHIHVEREGSLCHIVATDGRRLHLHTFDPGLFDTDIEMIEPGLYEVIAKTAKLIVIAPGEPAVSNFPNWRKVVPDFEPTHSDSINAMTVSKIGIVTGVLMAVDFVQDAIGFGHGRKKDSQSTIEYGTPDKAGPFVITHDLGKAIVMPMSMGRDTSPEAKDDREATPNLTGLEREPIKDDSEPAFELGDGVVKSCEKFVDGIHKAGMKVEISTGGKSVVIDGTSKFKRRGGKAKA